MYDLFQYIFKNISLGHQHIDRNRIPVVQMLRRHGPKVQKQIQKSDVQHQRREKSNSVEADLRKGHKPLSARPSLAGRFGQPGARSLEGEGGQTPAGHD